ncbi:MAG: 50S ribosomal protein L19 [Chitinophagales bacterium]|nr:50S ribosomal protein L19 [Chitinophagales bacterium]MDW8418009.1 50S ribosomal protein L19 [Chitinophagales bacterium]
MNAKIKLIQEKFFAGKKHPDFGPGDNITVSYKITEGNKERIQEFRGDVIQVRGQGATKMFTVRKISHGVGVERVFPLASPFIEEIVVNKVGRVRRAKLYYQRGRKGKASRIQEKRLAETTAE